MAYLDDELESPESFSVSEYVAGLDERWGFPKGSTVRLLAQPAGRRKLTQLDPLLFALVYFPHHLRINVEEFEGGYEGDITLTRMHLEACQIARKWIQAGEHRDAIIGPREIGKSTWTFLILPMWALAHRHRTFAIALADNSNQAMTHLITFKGELDANDLLRKDYPGLCEPLKRSSGASVADRRDLFVSRNMQAFRATGIDSSNLGIKVGRKRPDLIIFDDVEPGESNYSDYQKDQRLTTIINEVFPMNVRAAVIFAGTVFMAGSIMHDLVRVAMSKMPDTDRIAGVSVGVETGDEDDWPTWVEEQRITPHYYPAMWWDADGEPVSIWPQSWPAHEWLRGDKVPEYRTPAFQVSKQNNPRGRDDGWWTDDVFVHGALDPPATRWFMQIDPAVTDRKMSDYTGIVVAGWRPARARDVTKVEIAYADRVKLVGAPLRTRILKILAWYPQIAAIFVESNVGGDMWKQTLHGLPVQVLTRHSSLPKEVRIAKALDWYQRPGERVVHSNRACAKLELDMIAYPKIKHDDLVDAAALAVLRCLGTGEVKKSRIGIHTRSYVR